MFKSTTKSEITNAIESNFAEDMKQFANNDVIIFGGGPSGLIAARELLNNGIKHRKLKEIIILITDFGLVDIS